MGRRRRRRKRRFNVGRVLVLNNPPALMACWCAFMPSRGTAACAARLAHTLACMGSSYSLILFISSVSGAPSTDMNLTLYSHSARCSLFGNTRNATSAL